MSTLSHGVRNRVAASPQDRTVVMPAKETPIHATAQRILDAAIALFHERGFRGTSVKDITAACGLTPGVLYIYFPSKDSVLRHIVQYGDAVLEERTQRTLSAIASTDEAAALSELVDAYVWYVTEHQKLARVANLFWRELAEAEQNAARDVRRRITQTFVDAIARGVASGRFTPLEDGEIQVIAIALLGMLNGIMEWYLPNGRMSSMQISANFQQLGLRLVGDREARQPALLPKKR